MPAAIARPCAALLAILLLLGAGQSRGEDGPEPALATNNCSPAGELRGDPDRGSELHLRHCADCHGVDGRADLLVRHVEVTPADQSDPAYMQTLPDAFLYLAICKPWAATASCPPGETCSPTRTSGTWWPTSAASPGPENAAREVPGRLPRRCYSAGAGGEPVPGASAGFRAISRL
jgi:hypothetical protein